MDGLIPWRNKSMLLNLPRLLKRKSQLLKVWCLPFVGWVLSSCAASGPAVSLCIVDHAKQGFDCVTYPKTASFRTWAEGTNLECISPDEMENALKACKAHTTIPLTLCVLNMPALDFLCTDPNGNKSFLALEDADNYACMNDSDKNRLLERCH